MARKNADYFVMLPYGELERLMKAAAELDKLRQDIKRLSTQQAMLRGQFLELMDRFRQLE